MERKTILLLALCLLTGYAFAQRTVTGVVTDGESGTGLPGVNLIEKGTTNGASTDIDGNYSITVGENAILQFSYIGFQPQEIEVNNQTTINVTLLTDSETLDEVVVIGYGTQRKSDLTGSVSQVGGEDLQNLPAARVDNMLQGRAAGVQVSQISGEPGAATTIRIRGGNSIQGNNEPLWVIDGVIVGTDYNLSNLNTNDIESIDILKDAVAVSIYGTRGANGVILVTTKSGAGAQGTNVSFNLYRGQQSIVTQVDFLDGQEHAAYANEDAEFRQSAVPFPNLNEVPDIDWIDQVTQSAPVLNVDASVSGTSQNGRVNYYISGNYFNQDGLVRASGIEKYVFRANMDIKLSDLFKVGFRANLSSLRQENPKFNIDGLYLSTTPTRAIYDADGNFTALDPITDGISSNYEADIQLRQNHDQVTNLLGNAYLEFTPVQNLIFRTTISPEINNFKQNVFNPGALPNNLIIQNGGNATVNNSLRKGWINENTLTYNLDVGQNDRLTVLAGFTLQKTQFESSFARSQGLSNDVTGFNNLAFGSDPTRNEVGSSYNSFQLLSYLGRINYSLNDRFLFTLVGRLDGSSRFAPGNKYAFFPSGAFAWRMIEEDFIQNMNLFSNLKFRASFGLSGSQAIPSYRTLAVLNAANTTFGNVEKPGVVLGRPENPELKWETTRQLDLGLEMGFLDNRLAVEIDYYQKTTEDLLLNAQLPRQTGFVSKLQNIGKIENKGMELLINSANVRNNDFSWSTTLTISGNRNKVVDLGGVDFINLVTPAQQGGVGGRLIVGESVPVFTGVNYLGTWKSQEEIDQVGLGGNHDVGGPRFEDTNGDGQITEEDFIVLGSPQPDFYFGIGNTFNFKNFELDIFFQGTQGNEVFNSLTQTALFGRPETTKYKETLDRWTPENPTSDIPRAGTVASLSEVYNNSAMIEDGSHIRLKSLRLGYTFSGDQLGLRGVKGINVYITGSNLFVISDFRLKDPETSQFGRNSDNLSFGFSRGQYPSSRIISVGARVDF
ncbi:SusC/RagA family TonB-linked outer membrane protein [Flavilitoribacter nigricans]|uniref:SusC/RagA family TonB-linked outer membrane protein n=1 Tax=Flavilitoribacter nigricans (strain ATCC 23147 / DSM 23189 / NBRC 102662 / NCIMB 1420 / SS-2) TaxID=1122177 RepID=A0A2D0NJ65_FLAN2|nr:TonB-dependent receptor [Flavilitoribacter nigricans]PHN08239.1 SusC/RagA family TonB-linked outer membrane protein [Flavilitoribacter nigricans DSM 23189 = NBRC 102662]